MTFGARGAHLAAAPELVKRLYLGGIYAALKPHMNGASGLRSIFAHDNSMPGRQLLVLKPWRLTLSEADRRAVHQEVRRRLSVLV